ncbi:formylglycine-generating enzyme family protein [Myxococcota bacterium]|nr:formylglycine-generating enzyme family protein [Myxococcota bacterium]
MSGGLSEIRGWLVKGESSAGWLGICRILEGLEASEREMCLLYVAQHTKGWGESIRRPLYGWWEKHRRGEKTGFEGLVGDWTRYAWEEGRVAGEVREVASVAGMQMCWIPAGTFWMGSGEDDEEAEADEKPRRDVTLTRGFWMMETPVTQGQYMAVIGDNPAHCKRVGLDAPVECVSWHEAAIFANKLSVLEGVSESFVGSGEEIDGVGNKQSDYVGSKGWRLPAEAEWEYACRAGSTTPRYGEVDEIAWYDDGGSRYATKAVKQKQANDWGLYDTLGNVWEWCYDLYATYPSQTTTNPFGAAKGTERVARGGGWFDDVSSLRAARRCGYAPTNNGSDLGFRLVRSGL